MQTTWQPHTVHGDLSTRSDLPESVFAFPKQRKEPLTDADHVRNALARFDQVKALGGTDQAALVAVVDDLIAETMTLPAR